MTAHAPAVPSPPDYDGAWIGGIVPGLQADRRPDWLPAVARDAEQVVLCVLDGMGWAAVQARRTSLPTLAAMAGGAIDCAVPTTTATGLTSIATGLPPASHGLLGFAVRVGGEVLKTLQWRTVGGRKGPTPATVQPHPSFGGRDVPLVTRAEFRGTGFSDAHLRGGSLVGWRTTAVLVEHVRRLVEHDHPLVYAYYDGVDKVAHEFGLRNGFFDAELAAADRLVADLLAALPRRCALLVTADHGQVHVEHGGKLRLNVVAGLVTAYAGEARFRTLYARAGATRDLADACREAYGDVAWVLTRDELFDGGWFGPDASATVRSRIGDVALLARDPVAFIAPGFPKETEMTSFHGSLTADELRVPLLAGYGTASS
ncbi:alkaline phosphatase family protein [soil metagenome]